MVHNVADFWMSEELPWLEVSFIYDGVPYSFKGSFLDLFDSDIPKEYAAFEHLPPYGTCCRSSILTDLYQKLIVYAAVRPGDVPFEEFHVVFSTTSGNPFTV